MPMNNTKRRKAWKIRLRNRRIREMLRGSEERKFGLMRNQLQIVAFNQCTPVWATIWEQTEHHVRDLLDIGLIEQICDGVTEGINTGEQDGERTG